MESTKDNQDSWEDEIFPGESLGWHDIQSDWPSVPDSVKLDSLTYMQDAEIYCATIVSKYSPHEALSLLQNEADRLEALAHRAWMDSEHEPDTVGDKPDEAWWNAVVLAGKARYYRKVVARQSWTREAAPADTALEGMEKPVKPADADVDINEKRVRWCGQHIEQHGRPESIRDLFDLLPTSLGGKATTGDDVYAVPISVDGFRTSIKKVHLADGASVYVSSKHRGRRNPKAEEETMRNMVRFYLEGSDEKN